MSVSLQRRRMFDSMFAVQFERESGGEREEDGERERGGREGTMREREREREREKGRGERHIGREGEREGRRERVSE